MKRYCIKKNYRPRQAARTLVEDVSDYWTESRISSAAAYQHHVYLELAGAIKRSGRECRVADIGCGYPTKIANLILPLTDKVTLFDQPSMEPLMRSEFPSLRFFPLNLEDEQERSGLFDFVICADVIEHLLDPDPLLRFVMGLINEDGLIYISTPERDVQRGAGCTSSPHPEHVREWNSQEFLEYLAVSGMEVLDHILLPKAQVSQLEEKFLPLLKRMRLSRYAGGQLAICRPKRRRITEND